LVCRTIKKGDGNQPNLLTLYGVIIFVSFLLVLQYNGYWEMDVPVDPFRKVAGEDTYTITFRHLDTG
jgi:hypothetical protein